MSQLHGKAYGQNERKQGAESEDTHSLRGAFVSVLILGAMILGMWFSFFAFFMSRQ